ncbi:MAG: hypothetical protein WA001_02535 [Patescibacteria group bacterium]
MYSFPRSDSRLIGGLGSQTDSIGILAPIYECDECFFTGRVGEEAVVATEFLAAAVFDQHLAAATAVRLKRAYAIPGERLLVCLTEEFTRQLARAHCLNKSSLPELVATPKGRAVISIPPEMLPQQLVLFGSGLLRSADSELREAMSRRNLALPGVPHEHAVRADRIAHVALYRCFPHAEKQYRFSAYVRMLAGSVLAQNPDRYRMLLRQATNQFKLKDTDELSSSVEVLLEQLRRVSGTMPAVKP